ncbi:uncharacterized protein EKO05_0009792 [Ascochyta rabiei]|uniref:Uncharacterized protein n=1 Tax=Didymella rabiei TaxID=5454 RepID=A0A163END5_DIDRA|nr:uncharacterized protein EKO05_0009792 [Ascochyta rabiei]KZM23798.1 hypothetical protein ST47_g5074 [Ascochyta rabiei]UPX19532.1 hypothetical protein EKO05_0009792 [Ascochyta rabiei]
MPGGILPTPEELLSWPVPNYNDPVTKPKYVLVFSCIIGPISIALLLARLWVRIHTQRSAGWDDWLMLVAAFPVLALTIIFPLITENHRFNRHIWDVEQQYFPIQRKFVMAIYSLFSLASGLIKLSILLFYRRLSSRVVSPAFRRTMHIAIFVIGGYSVVFALIPIFMCRPISAFWDQVDFVKVAKGYEYKCINEGADVVAHGIISTVQDLVVAFLPTVLCWNLQMPIRQKIALYSILALGYTGVAIGAVRTYTGYRLFFQTYDVTWVASDTWLWSLLELHIGSMCANAPALKIFFAQTLKVDRLTTWTRSRSRSQSYGSKKQHSSKSNGAASTSRTLFNRMKSGRWVEQVLHSTANSSFRSQIRTDNSPDRRSTTLQLDAHFCPPLHPSPRDSMSKPLAPCYIEAIPNDSGRNSYVHDIEMNRLQTSQSSINEDVQALPPLQPPAYTRQVPLRLPPLSQLRMSWNANGGRYVWRPWQSSASVKEHGSHLQWG